MPDSKKDSPPLGISGKLNIFLQYCIPQITLTNLMRKITRIQQPWFKNAFTRWFVRRYQVNMQEAIISDIRHYKHFNAFFTRELKVGARIIDHSDNSLISPVDGAVSQIGRITGSTIIQAKGKSYTVDRLLAGDTRWVETFSDGLFATLYLSPKDYHRIHSPLDARLRQMTYVPGKLFSVNNLTAHAVDALFARNERVICYFDTKSGPLAVILVGAVFVAGMQTVWHGEITPPHSGRIQHWYYDEQHRQSAPVTLKKGDELGRFNMGSTVILLLPKNSLTWLPTLRAQSVIKMGESLGEIQPPR